MAVDALGEAALERGADRVVAVAVEQLVKAVDVADPHARPAMDQLGQVRERGATEADEVLALHVPLRALAGDSGDSLRSVLR
jgi:hypothetical protein